MDVVPYGTPTLLDFRGVEMGPDGVGVDLSGWFWERFGIVKRTGGP